MIKIYKTFNSNLKEVQEYEENCWINISDAAKNEVDSLSLLLGIPIEFLSYPLDINERARIEIDEGCMLIILRIPIREDEESEIPFNTATLGLVVKDKIIISVSSRRTNIFDEFIEGKVKNFDTGKRIEFLLKLFYKISFLYLKDLKEINNMTNSIERELHKSMKNEELIRLLNIEKSLVFFTTSLKENEIMMERFQRVQLYNLDDEAADLLEDVIIENKQAIEMANIYSNILSGMMDAFASVISNNLNVVMKVLTSITIILMLPTLVASIYGMNIHLPFQESPHAFAITMGFSLLLSVIGMLIFWKRDLF
ncbi:MAG: magnesium transporter CorA family protein [bacterium]|nr:magnesium transporter CorA family protein [bacterium]